MLLDKATPALFAALAEAQGTIANAVKNAINAMFDSEYADLGAFLDVIRAAFSPLGLLLSQSTAYDGEKVHVTTLVAHREGGYIVSTASCVPASGSPQDIGTATTYLRRYAAQCAAGIAQKDSDGNIAPSTGKQNRVDTREAPAPLMPQAKKTASDTSPATTAVDGAGSAKATEAAKAVEVVTDGGQAGGMFLQPGRVKLLRAQLRATAFAGSDSDVDAELLRRFPRIDDANFAVVKTALAISP